MGRDQNQRGRADQFERESRDSKRSKMSLKEASLELQRIKNIVRGQLMLDFDVLPGQLALPLEGGERDE